MADTVRLLDDGQSPADEEAQDIPVAKSSLPAQEAPGHDALASNTSQAQSASMATTRSPDVASTLTPSFSAEQGISGPGSLANPMPHSLPLGARISGTPALATQAHSSASGMNALRAHTDAEVTSLWREARVAVDMIGWLLLVFTQIGITVYFYILPSKWLEDFKLYVVLAASTACALFAVCMYCCRRAAGKEPTAGFVKEAYGALLLALGVSVSISVYLVIFAVAVATDQRTPFAAPGVLLVIFSLAVLHIPLLSLFNRAKRSLSLLYVSYLNAQAGPGRV